MRESLEQNIDQRLQQTLSPQQLLFARTLEMSGPEFEEEVRRVIDENPAIEVADDNELANPGADSGDGADSFDETSEQMQLADYRSDEDIPFYRTHVNNSSPDDPVFEPVARNSAPSLAEQLEEQLSEQNLTHAEEAVGKYIIGDIDGNGYLTRSTDEIVNDMTFNVGIDIDPVIVEKMVALIRTFDPPGVGAVDLRDSLMLQLGRMEQDLTVTDALEIVRNHYVLFTRKHFDRIAPAAGISGERARAAVELLRSLNPKPGSVFDSSDERSNHIIPDFEVEPDDEGHLILSMPNTLPHLRIEESFDIDDITVEQRRKGPARRQELDALTFIRRKRDEALDFIHAMTMRQQTLWRVMSAILKLQRDFFATSDPLSLRPMILKDVADLTGYDLSVISRATSGKYVATPAGTFPLKFFFNERPKEDSDISSHEILDTLKQIIATENRRKPLSDEALSAELKKRGYDIARRTVTKYREKLGFPVARLRREL